MREEIVIVKRFKFIGKEIRCVVTRGGAGGGLGEGGQRYKLPGRR